MAESSSSSEAQPLGHQPSELWRRKRDGWPITCFGGEPSPTEVVQEARETDDVFTFRQSIPPA